MRIRIVVVTLLLITFEDSPRFGRVCVGSRGLDACDRVVPVFPSTWGAIKSSYR